MQTDVVTGAFSYSGAAIAREIVWTAWIAAHGTELGRRYANELDRDYRHQPRR